MKLILASLFCFLIASCTSKNNNINDQTIQPVAQDETSSGDFIELHENGNIKIQGNLVDRKREGHWETFYPNGVKQSESNYKNGLLNGKSASYYPNGSTRYVGEYYDDKQTGIWYFYNEDGAFEKEVNYENGKVVK